MICTATSAAVSVRRRDGPREIGRVDESLVPTIIKDNRNNGFEFDEIIDIKAEEAYETAQETAKTDGLFLGTSAAAALTAAIQIAKRPEAAGKNIVVIYADNGYKYLSTDLYKRKKKSEAVVRGAVVTQADIGMDGS